MTAQEYKSNAAKIEELLHQAQRLANIAYTACEIAGDKAGQESARNTSAAICEAKLANYGMWTLKD